MSGGRDNSLAGIAAKQQSQREAFVAAQKRPLLSLEDARSRGAKLDFANHERTNDKTDFMMIYSNSTIVSPFFKMGNGRPLRSWNS